MWVALNDPPLGRWEHAGLMRTFCRGQWANPVLLPTSLAPLYKRLLTLYDLRLDADYRALLVTPEKAQEAVQTITELFRLIAQHTILEQENPL
jgi:hypothetical protein